MALWNPFRRSPTAMPSAIVPVARASTAGALIPTPGYPTEPEDTPRGEPPTDTFRDLPVAALGRWNLNNIRTALDNHQMGQFLQGAMLTESMLGDGRVQSALNGRLKGITMRHLHVRPVDNSADAKEAAEWTKWLWSRVLTDDVLDQSIAWTTIMGFGLAQRVWQTCRGRGQEVWCPYIQPWHPQYTYYDISRRQYVAMTFDGIEYIDPDDPHWWLFTPWGEYRGWLRGAIRACAFPWIVRQYALRDWARFSEVHGLPIKVLKAPAQSHAMDKARVTSQLRALGNSSIVTLPQQAGPDGTGWLFELMEAKDRAWEAFPGLIECCDREIQQVIRGTNLTSEVQGGSYAAAQVHEDEDSGYADSDCRKLVESFRSTVQMFLGYNFGWADKCPDMWMEAPDKPDLLQLAQAQQAAVTAFLAAKDGGLILDAEKHCERFSLPLSKVVEVQAGNEDGAEQDDVTDTRQLNARAAGNFNESDHPRQDDGKFGTGGGGTGGEGGGEKKESGKDRALRKAKEAKQEKVNEHHEKKIAEATATHEKATKEVTERREALEKKIGPENVEKLDELHRLKSEIRADNIYGRTNESKLARADQLDNEIQKEVTASQYEEFGDLKSAEKAQTKAAEVLETANRESDFGEMPGQKDSPSVEDQAQYAQEMHEYATASIAGMRAIDAEEVEAAKQRIAEREKDDPDNEGDQEFIDAATGRAKAFDTAERKFAAGDLDGAQIALLDIETHGDDNYASRLDWVSNSLGYAHSAEEERLLAISEMAAERVGELEDSVQRSKDNQETLREEAAALRKEGYDEQADKKEALAQKLQKSLESKKAALKEAKLDAKKAQRAYDKH